MLDSETRRKLSKLNRGRASDSSAVTPAETREPTITTLDQALPGRVQQHELGEFFICERTMADFRPDGVETVLSAVRSLGRDPEDVLFLDIETCGLANCPLFLVGTMSIRDDQVRVTQFFARDYSEEPAMLACIGDFMGAYGMLVTYNGRTFDVPYINDRMSLHRIPRRFDFEHLDLLVKARQKYRGVLPNCKLQTLETHLCNRPRYGDTPGHLIPQLYHNFVHTGNAAPIEGIFLHNALDLITMGELLPFLMSKR